MSDAAPLARCRLLIEGEQTSDPVTGAVLTRLAASGAHRSAGVPSDPRAHLSVIGVGVAGGDAVRRSASDGRIDSLVLVDPHLGRESIELIGDAPELAVLVVIDPAHRDRLAPAVEAHLASQHEQSDLHVEPTHPERVAELVGSWLEHRLTSVAPWREIVIDAPGGWKLHADLHEPIRSEPGPGVVLMHTGRSDRSVYARLARLLARRGIHVVNLDWRGRGRSTNRGRFIDLTEEEQMAARDDVAAAYDALAGLTGVDGSRLGVLGIAHGARFGGAGALRDPRTRALAVFTGFHAADEQQRRALASGNVEVLFVTGGQHRLVSAAMRTLYELCPGRRTRFVEYPEGVLGYQLFDLHPDLEPMIVDWFAEVLQP